jgi:hypothetical protein
MVPNVMLIGDLTPILLEDVRRDLAWLRDDGYEERDSLVVGSAFDLRFTSPHGELMFSADLGHGEIVIVLSPPRCRRDQKVSLNGFLGVRGHPLTDGYLSTQSVEAARKGVAAHARALASLRDTELAGDWTLFEEAKAYAGARREAAYDQAIEAAKDPNVRAVLEGRRRQQ